MRRMLCLILFLACCWPRLAHAFEWYEGGTLHKASLAQWKKTTTRNKVATASDWIAATSDKDALIRAGMDEWRRAAFALAACIDNDASGPDCLPEQQAGRIALDCMRMLQERYPFLLSR